MIQEDLENALDTAALGKVTITYKMFTASGSATFNPATGAVTSPYTSTSLDALVGPVTNYDASLLDIEVRSTDLKFLIDGADLPGTATDRDIVEYGGRTYDVYRVLKCPISNALVVYAKVSGGA